MRKLTGAVFLSLDGVMQAPGGPDEDPIGGFQFGGWTHPFSDESSRAPMGRYLMEPDYDLLLGKRTYDIFAAFWPYNQDNPIGSKFQRINKYVLTHSERGAELGKQPPASRSIPRKPLRSSSKAMAGISSSRAAARLYAPLLSAGLSTA